MLKKFISDLRQEFSGYNGKSLSQDLMAGLTVAAVALPLALAFGVSSGADAAAGLITAIFAGIVIGVLSGASYQISGPTGAMSAILLTISARYGIEGVLMAGLLSGVMLLIAALLKIGGLVSFIPAPVITGFTSGIAVIIALGQIDNFFGTHSAGENALQKLASYAELGFSPNWSAVLFGALVMLIMIFYPKKWNAIVPSSLAGIIVALIINIVINPSAASSTVAEVGAIPQSLVSSNSLLASGLDFSKIGGLIGPAFSIAALGMIESLLCGASAGKMKGEKLDATRELVAQGIGNILIPLFGGVPATAAIARTSVAIKSGGKTRLVSVFHSITLILSMFLLGGVMSRIPLAALAGVLMMTAWRMNEWEDIKHIFKEKWWLSIMQFAVTMVATVLFDLTIAILIGVTVAILMFVVKSSQLQVAVETIDPERLRPHGISGDHSDTKVAYLVGPLFFGTQEKLVQAIGDVSDLNTVILSMRGVPSMDHSASADLKKMYESYQAQGVQLLFCGLNQPVRTMMEQTGIVAMAGEEHFVWDAIAALRLLEQKKQAALAE